ncbi:MAG: VWA domain-containing protein [Bacteroidetes bacterium]|nr:VWA domain-containing protein [Bacteroidota bacterium]
MLRPLVIMLLAVMLCASTALSQTTARITTIHAVQGKTDVQFTLHVRCADEIQYMLGNSQLVVTDNGLPVEDFDIVESSSPTSRYAISSAVVMDASGSMTGSGNAGAKAAGHAFVDFMDGLIDEATVLWFTQVVTVYQQMTTVKPMLYSAVDALPASGATAVWDGIWQGLVELQSAAVNPKRAVVVLTDGGDNSSTRTPADVIQLAQTYNLRVFTIGLGSAINATELQQIALLTGGAYFQTPNANDLQSIFTQIATFMGRGYDEHTVVYRSPDPNALEHVLQVTVTACSEEATATFTERALTATTIRPTAATAPFSLELGQSIPNPVAPGGESVIPYTLSGVDSPQPLRLEVFDLLGRRVATLIDGAVSPGTHAARFRPDRLAPGIYLTRLSSGSMVTVRKMVVR